MLVLAIEEAQKVELGVLELGLCKGLTELLRAFRREFGGVEVLTDKVVGPKRPIKKTSKRDFIPTLCRCTTNEMHSHGHLTQLHLNIYVYTSSFTADNLPISTNPYLTFPSSFLILPFPHIS